MAEHETQPKLREDSERVMAELANRNGTPAYQNQEAPKPSPISSDELAAYVRVLSRTDGWQNLVTGLGDPQRDKRLSAGIFAARPSYGMLAELYRGSSTAARLVDRVADEMTRSWFDVVSGDDEGKDACEEMIQALQDLDTQPAMNWALRLARAFGGSGILIGANDGRKMIEPLDLDRLKSIDWLTVLDAYELIPETWYVDPANPKYGQPEVYRITPLLAGGPTYHTEPPKIGFFAPVHETRVLPFHGVITTRWQARETRGWGDSLLARPFGTIRDFDATWESVASLLQDFSQGVFAMKDLAAALASGKDTVVMTRLRMLDFARSTIRAAVIDAEKESFSRQQTPVAGLADLLRELATKLAADFEMPVTILMGVSPAGLNATGASDIRNWYDRIAAAQTRDLLPRLKRFLTLLWRAKKGPTGGKEPKKWKIVFKPLWQMSESETADLRSKVAATDKIYVDSQVVTPEEIAASRFGAGGWSMETVVDLDARKAMQATEGIREQPELSPEEQQATGIVPPGEIPPFVTKAKAFVAAPPGKPEPGGGPPKTPVLAEQGGGFTNSETANSPKIGE
jgi:uncharacterized protein